MRKDSPCAICPGRHECRDMCPLIKKWLENKRLAENLTDENIPVEFLGIEIEDITFH